jgi:general secretion pathway protein J
MKLNRGFTLIELLIAVTVLAIMSTLAYQGLNTLLRNHGILTQQAQVLTDMSQAVIQLQNDLRHIVPRPIHDKYNLLPALRLDPMNPIRLSITRSGIPNPTGIKRSSLQRIDYVFMGNKLTKRNWIVLDNNNEMDYSEQLILSDLSEIKFQVLGLDGIWYSQWPGDRNLPMDLMPKAIKFTFNINPFGEISRIIQLPL